MVRRLISVEAEARFHGGLVTSKSPKSVLDWRVLLASFEIPIERTWYLEK